MIKIKLSKNHIEISGHALYDDYGKDIVCASVSSIVITTINGILSIDDKAIKYSQDDNLVIDVLKDDDITNKLILNMINLLKQLEKQYKKNIQIKEV